MTLWTIQEILAGRVEVGAPVIVEGWLRTRRDSNAELSFLQIHARSGGNWCQGNWCQLPCRVAAPKMIKMALD